MSTAASTPRLRLPIAAISADLRSHLATPAVESDDDPVLQVGDLAKSAGKTVRAIHLYEELGLLRPHRRSKGRYRLFGTDALVRVRWIGKLQDLGLTLSQIQDIVKEWEQAPSAPGAMQLMRSTYQARLEDTRGQIARLRALESELAASLHYLHTCDTCDPARLIAACSACDLHACDHHAPELVAGFRAGASPKDPRATAPADVSSTAHED